MKNFITLFLVVLLSGCSYSFKGASIPAEMKNITINYFENNSLLVVPTLSQDFTEALKTRIRTQSKLNIIQTEGDAILEGRITNYTLSPVAIQDNTRPTAGATRLTIRVNVKYINNLDPTKNFEQSFERFKDFTTSNQSLQTAELQNIKAVIDLITEDIFNRAFSQW